MIIMIIFITLFVLATTGLILWVTVFENCIDDEFGIACLLVMSIGGLAMVGSGIACIAINEPSNVKAKEYALAEKINLYNYDKQILESYHLVNDGDKTSFTSDITLEVVSTAKYYEMVRDYNTKIYNFKCEVKGKQYKRDNPWISWFTSKAYQSVSDEMLTQLEYTPGK